MDDKSRMQEFHDLNLTLNLAKCSVDILNLPDKVNGDGDLGITAAFTFHRDRECGAIRWVAESCPCQAQVVTPSLYLRLELLLDQISCGCVKHYQVIGPVKGQAFFGVFSLCNMDTRKNTQLCWLETRG